MVLHEINLFLDDIRFPKNSKVNFIDTDWTIVRDYFEFVNYINNNFDKINIISFDHDLACIRDGKEFTGKDAVNYLINYCMDNDKKLPYWFIHSDNTSGKENMKKLLLSYINKVENIDISNCRYYHFGFINGKFY
jgi:hypothetical protein